MSSVFSTRGASLAFMVTVTAMTVGCGQPESDSDPAAQVANTSLDADGHDHSGWWCAEHGIPEKDCSLCSSDAAAKFKDKGDWCEEHNRAESQCFKCDATRAEKFAKLYQAKFGHEPPEATE